MATVSPFIDVRERGRLASRSLEALLRNLATTHSSPHLTLSLFLDTRWRDEQQRERVRLTVRDRARELRAQFPDDHALGRDLDRALAFTDERVRQEVDVGFGGAALFLCSPRGIDLELRSRTSWPTLIAAGPAPLVAPLCGLGRERVLVALVDAHEVSLYELALGRLDERTHEVGGAPRRHALGASSQAKYQQQRAQKIDELHKRAAEALAHLFDEAPPEWVLVGGRAEAAANFRRQLPERVAARVKWIDALEDQPPDEVTAAAEQAIGRAEGLEERAVAGEIAARARAGGRGAIGVSAVVRALNEARPYRVLVAEGVGRQALLVCGTCGVIAEHDAQSDEPDERDDHCAACGNGTVAMDGVEAIARAAIPLDARVDVVEDALLDEEGGAAALLRY